MLRVLILCIKFFFMPFIQFPFEYERVNMIEYWHQFRSHKTTQANQTHQITESQWEAHKMLYWPHLSCNIIMSGLTVGIQGNLCLSS